MSARAPTGDPSPRREPDARPLRSFLLLLPAGVSALGLAAHFLRRGQALPMLLALALFTLLFVRRRWAARAVQLGLLSGTLVWLRTLAVLAGERRAAGEPWARLAVILGAVALLSLGGALALETPRLRRRFAARPAEPPPSALEETPGGR